MSNLLWPVMEVTVFMTAISWSMQRGPSRRGACSTWGQPPEFLLQCPDVFTVAPDHGMDGPRKHVDT
jgi:hypothetical protein